MRCPYCGSLDDKVIESRTMLNGESIRRRPWQCASATSGNPDSPGADYDNS